MINQKLTFEQALEKLENTVDKLGKGELSLDDSLAAFETGVKLSKFCSDKLKDIEAKVEIIKEENGKIIAEDYIYKIGGE